MATADEILSGSLDVLSIDWDTRLITIPSTITNIGVESDDDVLRLKFTAPRYYGDLDVTTCKIFINILNANLEEDRYEVTDMEVSPDDEDTVTFSWLVGRFAIQYKGNVNFVVCMKKINIYDIVEKELNTTRAVLPVLEGLEPDAIIAKYPDAIQEWMDKLEAKEDAKIQIRLDKMDAILENFVFVEEVGI